MSIGNDALRGLAAGTLKDPFQFYGNLSNIIGRPHNYLQSTDSMGRAFARHMLPTAPLVMIRPGRVEFQDVEKFLQGAGIMEIMGFKSEEETKQLVKEEGNLKGAPVYGDGTGYGVTASDKLAIEKAIERKSNGGTVYDYEANGGSARYYEFKPAPAEYADVVATMTSRLFSRMLGDVATWNTNGAAAMENGGFMAFWADNASSVSETAGAEVESSMLSGLANTVTNLSKQAGYIFQVDPTAPNAAESMIAKATNSIASMIGDPGGNGTRAALGNALLGLHPLFPEMWKDSSFSRSYNISFKFHSPYGSPEAIFQNVFLPFTYLLSLVLPLMRTPSSYSSPFVFQLDCPGYFACDLGICTDFSFVKGGSENLWTIDGLPRAIDVTMQVKDLYPTLMASHNSKSMYLNIGMSTFLDNLATISLSKAAQKMDIVSELHSKIDRLILQTVNAPQVLRSELEYYIFEKMGVARFFR